MATRRSTLTNKRRKGPMAVALPFLKRFGIILGIATIGFVAGSWYWLSGNMGRTQNWINNKTVEAGADMGFAINNILVEGRVHTNPDALKAILNVEKGDPLFSFNPDTAREQIEKMNWVRAVRVERRLPDTVYVGITEKKPLALWQKGNELKLLDEKGEVIEESKLSQFKDLVIVMGDDATPHAPDLLKNLEAEPFLLKKIKAAKWIGGRRWDLVFPAGVTAKLPEGEIGLALRRLGQAAESEGLLEKDIVFVDLREDGRMIVQTTPGAVQEYQASKTGSNI